MASQFTSFKRVLMGALALFGAGALSPVISGAQAAGWKPDPDDALLLEARLGKFRLGDGVRGYTTPSGPCLDLADMIMALDVPVRLDKKLRRATGWVFEERRTFVIDREAQTVQIMNNKEALAEGDILDAPEGWCVKAARLSDWLGLELNVDEGNAVLSIVSKQPLPVELALERRGRAAKIRPVVQFDLASLPQARTPMKGFRAPVVDVVINAGAFRQAGGRSHDVNMGYELFAAGEAGPVSYDARISASRAGAPDSVRIKAYRIDPDGQLLGPFNATQVAAGDVSGVSTPLVSQSGAGRGAFITNRPLQQQARFDVTDFRGELPAGWDAELYRNGELLGFAGDRADGRYEFLDVPLSYGQNRFEVVLYGPQGQVRREERTISVGADSIPPRQTWYWAGLLQDGHDLIGVSKRGLRVRGGWRASAGFERGLNTMTSVYGYGHRLMRNDGTHANYGEFAVRRAIGPTLTEISAASSFDGGMAYRAQMFGQFGRTNVELESILARGGFRSDQLLGDVRDIHSLTLHQGINLGKQTVPVRGSFRLLSYQSGIRAREANLRASASFGRISLTGELDWRSQRQKQGPPPPDQLDTTLYANARIGKVRLRGETHFKLKPVARFESLALVGEWDGKGSRDGRRMHNWRAEIAYDGAERRLRGSLGFVRQFERFALTASAGAGSDGSLTAGLNIAFSLGPDPARPGRMRVTSDRLGTSGQLLATVFRDLNGDGIRQADEPGEHDVQITAGRTPVERLSNANGDVVVDGLQPWMPLLIGVDGSSLPDPMVQPVGPGKVIHPRPGVIARIELPLVSAGEVDGTLVRADGGSVEAAELELIDAAGIVVARTKSEYDGFFLFESVPYGRYAIRVARLSAEAHRLSPNLSAVAVVNGKQPLAKLGEVQAESTVRNAQGP